MRIAEKYANLSSEKQQDYVVKGEMDLSDIAELDRSVPLLIAVARDDHILQRQIIDLEKTREIKKIEFEMKFQYGKPGRKTGFHVIVTRGDLRDSDILGTAPEKKWIQSDQWTEEKSQKPVIYRHDLKRMKIPDARYKRWFLSCRVYTIRGRVVCRSFYYDTIEQQWVFRDSPVPGATVEVFDIDRFFWIYSKDLIQTAVTNVDGTFEMKFIWCCRRLFPIPRPWIIDPDLLRRIRELLIQKKFPIPLPDPPNDPILVQQFIQDLNEMVVGNVSLKANVVSAKSDTVSKPVYSGIQLQSVLPAASELEMLHVWPWWSRPDCSPDIIFRVTQPCNGKVQIIYDENVCQTRWNIPQLSNVLLEANNKACCLPVPPDPPAGDCLVPSKISCVHVSDIGSTIGGILDFRGYAYPNSLDRPFGGSFSIYGDFGELARNIVDFYSVEYHKDGTPPDRWVDMGSIPNLLTHIGRKFWNCLTTMYSPIIDFGPESIDGKFVYRTLFKYQRDHHGESGCVDDTWLWDDYTKLFSWNSESLPEGDGLYQVRIIGYQQAPDGSLKQGRVMPLCGTELDENMVPATVYIRIDNRIPGDHPPSTTTHPCGPDKIHQCTVEPDCDIVAIVKNEGVIDSETEIDPCDIVTIEDADTITIHYSATVPSIGPDYKDAHLLAYSLTSHYGESNLINVLTTGTISGDPTPEFGPTYQDALSQGAVRPHWKGGNFKVTLKGTDFPKSCAYLFRLRAWKRTTDGCTNPYYFHANICEFSICVIRPISPYLVAAIKDSKLKTLND